MVTTVINDSLFRVEGADTLREALKVYRGSKTPFLDCLKIAKARRRKVKEAVAYSRRFEKAGLRVIRP
ncbi:MAG: hypothetical protein Q9N34_06550 [Aquificota bacterium]|nr:hypothetical protein [Aquificota bacterium]